MARPNYQHEKRQKDLARKKKQDEKRARKADKTKSDTETGMDPAPDAEPPSPPSDGDPSLPG